MIYNFIAIVNMFFNYIKFITSKIIIYISVIFFYILRIKIKFTYNMYLESELFFNTDKCEKIMYNIYITKELRCLYGKKKKPKK